MFLLNKLLKLFNCFDKNGGCAGITILDIIQINRAATRRIHHLLLFLKFTILFITNSKNYNKIKKNAITVIYLQELLLVRRDRSCAVF